MKEKTPSTADVENAVAIMFVAVEDRPEGKICAGEISRCRKWSPRHRRKIRLGTRLIATYREESGRVGKIDWEKFRAWIRQWLDKHSSEINFARLVVSLLMLLLIL